VTVLSLTDASGKRSFIEFMNPRSELLDLKTEAAFSVSDAAAESSSDERLTVWAFAKIEMQIAAVMANSSIARTISIKKRLDESVLFL
jgi:hypothetical protein